MSAPGPPAAPGARASRARDVDRGQLRALLVAYARLSVRVRGARLGRTSGRRRGPLGLGVAYLVMGVVMGVVALDHPGVFTFGVLVHTATLVMTLSMVGIVAGDVLFGAAEEDVLGFLPVSPATRLLAKTLNLAAVAAVVALVLNLGPMFLGLQCRGARPWFPLAHAVSSVGLALFAAAAQVFLFALLARILGRERLERAMTWTQVLLSVTVAMLSQVLPRLSDLTGGLRFERHLALLAPFPMAWFAALDAVLGGTRAGPGLWALAAGGCAVTALLGWAAVRRLAPRFDEAAAALRETPATVAPARRARRGRGAARRGGPLPWPLALWLRDPVERGAFRLAVAYVRRDRETMLRLWPAVGPLVAIPLITLFQRAELVSMYVALTGILLAILPVTVLGTLEVSSQHAAAELFLRAPLADGAAVFHGVRKAVFACCTLPAGVALAAVLLLLSRGRPAVLLPVLPYVLLVPMMDLLPAFHRGYLPLSLDPQRGTQGARTFGDLWWALPALLVVGFGFGVARRLGVLPWMLAGEVVAVAIVRAVLLRRAVVVGRLAPAE